MKLPPQSWKRTWESLGFVRKKRSHRREARRHQIESLEVRQFLHAAPVLAATSLVETLPAGVAPATNSGIAVSALVGGETVDTGGSPGIAITAVDVSQGAVQFSVDGGSTWATISGVSDSNALLLSADSNGLDLVRVDVNASGTQAPFNISDAITFRAWDQTQDAGDNGLYEDASANGGSTAFSSATDVMAATLLSAGPSISEPGSQSMNVDDALTFSGDNGNSITVTDADAATMSLTLSVGSGTLNAPNAGSISVSGAGTATLVLSGAPTDVSNALDGLTYTPDSGFVGSDTLTITADDDASSGDGVDHTASAQVALSVQNSPPSISAPYSVSFESNASIYFGTEYGDPVVAYDPDGENLELSLSTSYDPIYLGTSDAVSIVSGSNGSNSLTIDGNAAAINSALEGMAIIGEPGEDDTLWLSLYELGGPSQTASTSVAIDYYPPQPPSISAPSSESAGYGGEVVFSNADGDPISVSSPDNGYLTLTLSTSSDLITLANESDINFISGYDNSTDFVIEGDASQINGALDGMSVYYTEDGDDTLWLSVNEESQTASTSVALDYAPSSPPSISAPSSESVSYGGEVVFSNADGDPVSISSPDGGYLTLVLSTGSEPIYLANSGINMVDGYQGSNFVEVEGYASDIDSALDGMYLQNWQASGDILSLSLYEYDGSYESASASVAIDYSGGDYGSYGGPTISTNYSLSFTGDEPSGFCGGSVYDPNEVDLEMTISVDQGTLNAGGGWAGMVSGLGSNTLTINSDQNTINSLLNDLTYAPNPGFFGTANLTLSVSEDGGDWESASANMPMYVSEPPAPSLEGVSNYWADDNVPLSFSAMGQDGGYSSLTYSLTDESMGEDGASVDPQSGLFAWTPDVAPGSYDFVLTATDGYGQSASQWFEIDVQAVAPELAPIDSRTISEGAIVSFPVQATDPEGDYEAGLNYSLGETPAGASIDPNSGQFTWSSNAAPPGMYAFTVVVSNDWGESAAETFYITSTDQATNPATLDSQSSQTLPSVASDSSGNYVTVWYGDGAIWRQLFSNTGAAIGGNFQVSAPARTSTAPRSRSWQARPTAILSWPGLRRMRRATTPCGPRCTTPTARLPAPLSRRVRPASSPPSRRWP